jgi:curli biogenesis system outer membrane secretion channel CsgG
VGLALLGVCIFHKQPRLLQYLGAGFLVTGGIIEFELAARTAKWVQFGAYLEKATQPDLADGMEADATC